MRYCALALALATPRLLSAQDLVVSEGSGRPSARIIRTAVARPHVVLSGTGRLDLPRDSTITTTLIVLGRPTYLASRVQGDVVVIGSDLYLRPGVEITGRAVAIGGSVALTTLGHVAGGAESFRDETYAATAGPGGLSLAYQVIGRTDPTPLLQLAGLQGLLMPSYDRVEGLSLPIGALLTFGDRTIEVEPSATYRSRLGKLDPAVLVRIQPDRAVRFEGVAGYDTRSNDKWNYSDFVNSATTFFAGTDTRNYFRSRIGEGRLYALVERAGVAFEPYIGGRYESISPVSATGNVFSVIDRKDPEFEHIRRPNPPVEGGAIGSGLVGAELYDTAGVVASRVRAEAEQSFTTMKGTRNFTQLTLDARVGFPTFRTQRLSFRAHGVATLGDSVPRSRYAYLGGSGSLPVLELLELGGSQLLFVESDYMIPIESVILPLIGSPVVTLRHLMGAAGVRSLPTLEQEIGIGLGLSALRLDATTDVARKRGTKFGIGISLSK